MDLQQAIEQHELGRADIEPPADHGRRQPAVSRLVCRQCYRRGLLGALRDWSDYAGHLARMIEEARR